MFHDVLSGVEEMVAAKPVADGQRTHPLPPLGLYVTLYKAFLSVSQAWCVYSELGAYPWHWLFEPSWRFTAARLIEASGRNGAGPTHCTGYRRFKLCAQFSATLVRPGLRRRATIIFANVLIF